MGLMLDDILHKSLLLLLVDALLDEHELANSLVFIELLLSQLVLGDETFGFEINDELGTHAYFALHSD